MEQTVTIDRRAFVLGALERYETRLLRFAVRLLGDENAARDAVQHVFLRLCGESAERLGPRLRPWLFAVCRNYAIDILRRRDGVPGRIEPADCVDDRPDPAASAEQADLTRSINRLVDQLPTAQREAVLFWSEGFSYRQIAEMTSATEGNVRVIVHRALKQLRRHPAVAAMRG